MYEVLIQKQYNYSLLRFPEMESSKIIPKPLPEMSSSLESLNKYLPIIYYFGGKFVSILENFLDFFVL